MINRVKAFDGSYHPEMLPRMNCGGIPIFNNEAGYGYFCDTCCAVIGSMSQPQTCKEINNAEARDNQ